MNRRGEFNPLKEIVKQSRGTFWSAGLFSSAVNILMLTGPLFMLQVYDRVLASRSVPTLVGLFGFVVVLYLFLALFDFIKTKTLSRAGFRLDVALAPLAKKAWIYSRIGEGQERSRPVSDLATIRQFLCSNGLPALFDLPWVPFYLFIVYLMHIQLGLLATVGAVIVITATLINEGITRRPIGESSKWGMMDAQFAENSSRNAEPVIAMGMIDNINKHWLKLRHNALGISQIASGRSDFIIAFTKAIRMLVQSAILALGAWLTIQQEITPGVMIAASILGGRALAPVDQAVGNWKNFIRTRQAYSRLSNTLANLPGIETPVALPEPKGHLSVSNLVKFPPGAKTASETSRPILQGLHFDLDPGDGLGVIGPSASGKSSLARLLVGLWMPDKGAVRLDKATFDQWDRAKIGKHIGYLPQSVGLLSGTVRQNIARFDEEVSDEAVVEAANLAGVHDLILKLPDGYSTDLSDNIQVLSGGQIQRIALARAVLNKPSLLVLDEPNSNLDAEGDIALANAIEKMRENGSCVIVMAHRSSAIAAVNKVLMLNSGRQMEFGDRDEILAKVTRRQSPNIKVMQDKGAVSA